MNYIVGITVMLLMPIIFFALILGSIKESFARTEFPCLTKKDILISELVLLLMLLMVYIVINQNDFIYFWDYGREWKSAIIVKNNLLSNPFDALKNIYWSINNEDYNQFMPTLIALPLYLVGASFEEYVFLVEAIYMVPAVLVISLLIYKIFIILRLESPKLPVMLTIIAATPILHYVMFDGFMDPPVLMLVACSLMLSVDFDYANLQPRRCILLSFILTLLVLFRRHFAYFVVGYLVSQLFFAALQFGGNSIGQRKNVAKGYIENMMLIGSISLLVLGLFFRGFLFRSIFNNFDIAYEAYDVSLAEKLARIQEVFGWLVLLVVVIFPLIATKKNKKICQIIVPLIVNIVVTTGLLWRVLQMNYHQYYLILVQVLVLLFVGVFSVIGLVNKKAIARGGTILFLIVSVTNMGVMLIPSFRNMPGKTIFTDLSYAPKKRTDMEEIEKIVNDLNDIAAEEENTHFYTLASSAVLNSNIISMAGFPDKINAVPQMYSTNDVDLRDGFPTQFFDADYVLVADPIQTHLPNGTQEVVRYLAEQILNQESILGSYYHLEREYSLEKNVKVGLYKRLHIIGSDVYEELKNYYERLYPDVPELFSKRLEYPTLFFPAISGGQKILNFESGELKTEFKSNSIQPISNQAGYLVYGPYKRIEKGEYSVEYRILGNEEPSNNSIGFVDIFVNGMVIDKKEIEGGSNIIKIEDLNIAEVYDDIEFRIFVTIPEIKFDKIIVTRK